jgi:hypothetical protein
MVAVLVVGIVVLDFIVFPLVLPGSLAPAIRQFHPLAIIVAIVLILWPKGG